MNRREGRRLWTAVRTFRDHCAVNRGLKDSIREGESSAELLG